MVHSILVKITVGVLQKLEKFTLKFMTEKGMNNGINIQKGEEESLVSQMLGHMTEVSHTTMAG